MTYPLREEVVRLRAYQGSADSEAAAALENKRRAAVEWMRDRGIENLNDPVAVTPPRAYTGAVNTTMEGV